MLSVGLFRRVHDVRPLPYLLLLLLEGDGRLLPFIATVPGEYTRGGHKVLRTTPQGRRKCFPP
jgi:hypothetical protein